MRYKVLTLIITICYLTACHNFIPKSTQAKEFPKDWTGIWKGDLKIVGGGYDGKTIPMELHILPIDSTDAYTWTIVYDGQKRNYQLIPTKKGYSIDEKNGIILALNNLDGKLYSKFEVAGSDLLTSYQMINNEIHFETIFGSTKGTNTGDIIHEGDTIPKVVSYTVKGRQHAILKL